jgi:hypothetical protein
MHWSRRAVLGTIAASAATLAGCSGGSTAPTPTGTAPQHPDGTYGYTHLTPGGNRVLGGSGAVASMSPVEIPIEGEPAWLLAFDGDEGSIWTIVRSDGTATTHQVTGDTVEMIAEHGTVASPPVGYAGDGSVDLLDVPAEAGDHTYGSRNLDGGLAADLDADGRTELLVPTTDRTRLARLTASQASWAGRGRTAVFSPALCPC